MVSDRLERLLKKNYPGVNLSRNLNDQLNSIQLATLLNDIEVEFSISFSTAELIFMDEVNMKSLEAVIAKRIGAG